MSFRACMRSFCFVRNGKYHQQSSSISNENSLRSKVKGRLLSMDKIHMEQISFRYQIGPFHPAISYSFQYPRIPTKITVSVPFFMSLECFVHEMYDTEP